MGGAEVSSGMSSQLTLRPRNVLSAVSAEHIAATHLSSRRKILLGCIRFIAQRSIPEFFPIPAPSWPHGKWPEPQIQIKWNQAFSSCPTTKRPEQPSSFFSRVGRGSSHPILHPSHLVYPWDLGSQACH